MQRLLVGKDGGGDHAQSDRELTTAKHDHRSEQKDDDDRDLGGEPYGLGR